jgi:hypothetical protein
VKLALARAFVEAVEAHDFEAAEKFLDPDVENGNSPRHASWRCSMPESAREGERRRAIRHGTDGG